MRQNCTVYRTVDYIAKRWAMLILLEVYKGKNQTKRYSELKRSLPDITSKLLSVRLKELEKQGLIKKKIDSSSFPVKCEYSLSNSGIEFIKIIKDIKLWALKWKITNKECGEKNCMHCEF